MQVIIKILTERDREESKTNPRPGHQEHDRTPMCRVGAHPIQERQKMRGVQALSVILRGNHKGWLEYAWPMGSGTVGRCGLVG